MEQLVVFIIGIVLGVLIVLIINWLSRKETKKIAEELISQTESQKIQDLENLINRIKDSFGALSFEALSKNTEEFLKLARETLSTQTQMGAKELEEKKKLIDQTLEVMKGDLQRVQDLVTQFEKDREQKFGELANQLRFTAEQTSKLQETAAKLHTALANTKVRGQWGERMAEDILRLVGFIEGINYKKQKTLETGGTRPDYTFLLPKDLKVNMDVKFPLDNYLRYLEAEQDSEKEKYKNLFLKDVRKRIKEVTTKDYINPEENTVDFVIVFIPNEQVYAFINENDSSVLDDALENKVILCSPITLYAILSVIRQAIDNFNLEKKAAQILSLLGAFYKGWNEFLKSLEKVGKKIEEAQNEFNALITTRRKKLERPLKQIEDLKIQKGIDAASLIEEDIIPIENSEELKNEK
jgi:DNA recombination protein RmuC